MIGFHDDRVHGGADDRVHGGTDESRGCRGAFRGVELAEKFGHRIHVLHDACPSRNNRHPRRRPIPGWHALVIRSVDAVGNPEEKEACQDKEVLPN